MNIPIFSKLRKRKIQKTIDSLDGFIQQLYWGENLSQEESDREIERGLVEITCNGKHSSNGILITEDGYFLTPYHCVDKIGGEIVNSEGRVYRIEEVCARSIPMDLALVKADIPANPSPKNYRLYTNGIEKIPVKILTKRNGEINSKYGIVIGDSPPVIIDRTWEFKNGFIIKGDPLVPGDSGGIICSPDRRIMGLATNIAKNDKDGRYEEARGSKILHALELIHFYKTHLENKI